MNYLNFEYFFYQIYRFLVWLWQLRLGPPQWLPILWGIISIGLLFFIMWLLSKLSALRHGQRRDLTLALQSRAAAATPRNQRWEKVLKYLESENPAEWKLAIIEADNILDDLVATLQPHGENLGERLKSIEPADFETLNEAWEAHKVRNQIAHESSFDLTKRQATITIGQYQKVFEEFDYI